MEVLVQGALKQREGFLSDFSDPIVPCHSHDPVSAWDHSFKRSGVSIASWPQKMWK